MVLIIDPWYANIVNYIVAGCIPPGANKKKIIRGSRVHVWDNPYIGCASMVYLEDAY
jgi:hypothetical protein